MPAYKNKENGSWYVVTQYTDWTGERKPKCKRGFATRREALEWEQKFQQQSAGDLDMSFEAFCEIYTNDLNARLKESTWQTKENIIKTKLLPYFGKRKINEITTKDVIVWQNELLAYRDEKRKPYSQTYLKTLHNQLSAIFNHAVRFYDLHSNPAAKAGNMGTEERREMLFWTKEEYQKFAEEMMDKPVSYYAFQMLYWTGIREGELLALTPADFDFERGTVKISKTYQRLKGQDVISYDLSGAVNQVLNYRDKLTKEYYSLCHQGSEPFEVLSPKCVVIIGKMASLTPGQVAAFENFRNSLGNVLILTFDELYQRIVDLISVLSESPAQEQNSIEQNDNADELPF